MSGYKTRNYAVRVRVRAKTAAGYEDRQYTISMAGHGGSNDEGRAWDQAVAQAREEGCVVLTVSWA